MELSNISLNYIEQRTIRLALKAYSDSLLVTLGMAEGMPEDLFSATRYQFNLANALLEKFRLLKLDTSLT